MWKMLLMGLITITQFINNMTLEEKVGQLFLFGFEGQYYGNSLERLINNHIGNFIIYSRNVRNKEQVKKLIRKIKEKFEERIPPIIAVDQEGEMIARIRDIFVPPNAMALGSLNKADITYKVGFLLGKELKEIGIDMDFAPVLDVNDNPYNPIIGVRAFWKDKEIVSKHAVAFFRGLEDAGIIPVGKHFPGHGNTKIDSHVGLPVIDETKSEIIEKYIYPFKIAINEGIPAIMTAHILIPSWSKYPATFSKEIIDFLRKDLNFKGVIISDDLLMGAISKNYKIEMVVENALLNGVDMFIIWKNLNVQMNIYNYILTRVRTGYIPEKVIDKAVERIIRLKLKFEKINSKNEEIVESVLWKKLTDAIALCKGTGKIDPKKSYIVFFPYSPNVTVVQEKAFLKSYINDLFKKHLENVKIIRYNMHYPVQKYKRYIDKVSKYDGVIVFTLDLVNNIKVKDLINEILKKNKNNIVIAIRSPYDILFLDSENVNSYITTYSWNKYFAQRLLDNLLGNSEFRGNCILEKGGR